MQIWIEQNTDQVIKLKKQLTEEQCYEILKEFPDKELIKETLLQMDNYAPLTKRYISVYLTLRNWLRNAQKRAKATPGASGSGWVTTYDKALDFMDHNKIKYDRFQDHFEKVERAGQKPLWRKK